MADIINLTRGNPDPAAFPIDDLIQCSADILKRDGKVLLQYMQSPGYGPLREWFANRYGVKPANIFMGNSSLEILNFISQIELKPGVRAFAESPSYDRANTLLSRYGAEVVGIPMEADGVDLNVFEKELKKGVPAVVYIIADFQNPMGTTTSDAKRKQIAKWAQQYGFYVAEDAPYRSLRYRGTDVPTIMSYAPDRVLHMSSFSKLLAPGLRMGYMVGPEAIVTRLSKWAVDTYIGPVLPTQGMVYEYVSKGLLEPNIEKLKKIYGPRMDAALAAIDKYIPGTILSRPEGGYFVCLNLPRGNSMDKLLPRADAIGLKLTDGRGFFLNKADGDHFLRIPYCQMSPEEMEKAIQKVASILE
jgi:DNA-binding transcriptional MocR family regulator